VGAPAAACAPSTLPLFNLFRFTRPPHRMYSRLYAHLKHALTLATPRRLRSAPHTLPLTPLLTHTPTAGVCGRAAGGVLQQDGAGALVGSAYGAQLVYLHLGVRQLYHTARGGRAPYTVRRDPRAGVPAKAPLEFVLCRVIFVDTLRVGTTLCLRRASYSDEKVANRDRMILGFGTARQKMVILE
jgi:hypothetical protein